jgi:hypothetical protein
MIALVNPGSDGTVIANVPVAEPVGTTTVGGRVTPGLELARFTATSPWTGVASVTVPVALPEPPLMLNGVNEREISGGAGVRVRGAVYDAPA